MGGPASPAAGLSSESALSITRQPSPRDPAPLAMSPRLYWAPTPSSSGTRIAAVVVTLFNCPSILPGREPSHSTSKLGTRRETTCGQKLHQEIHLSAKSSSKAPLLWVRIGNQMSKITPSPDCATLTGSSAATTTMEIAVLDCARSAMTTSDIMSANQMAACPACRAGLGNTVISLYVFLAVTSRMATAASQMSATAVQVGRAPYAMNVSPTMAVVMAPAPSPGNVPAMRAGEVCFVTKILITALTTLRARMDQLAPTVGRGAIPAPVSQATLVSTVSWNSASVPATPVEMVAAVRTMRIATTACVPRATMASTVNTVP